MNDPIIHAPLSKIVEAIMKHKCRNCNGDGYTAEHHPSCIGDCDKNGCPHQVQCEDCHARGYYYTEDSITEALASLGGEDVPRMTAERIKEIQSKTAYPDSHSVMQALMQVWNECEQSRPHPSEREVLEGFKKWLFKEQNSGLCILDSDIDQYLAEKQSKTE